MEVIYKDTPEEQDAVYINGKKLGRLPGLKQAKDEPTAAMVLGRWASSEGGNFALRTKEADPKGSFKTVFTGLRRLLGIFTTPPSMTVQQLWSDRQQQILRRANIASFAWAMKLYPLENTGSANYGFANETQMDQQGQAILDQYKGGEAYGIL